MAVQNSTKLGNIHAQASSYSKRHHPDFTMTHIPYTLCLKNDADVAHYNFDADQPILVIFGRDFADIVYYQMVICYPTSPN